MTPTTDRHREARERVARYVEARTGMSGLGPDEVHAIWVNREEEERRLLLSDLRELLASPADSLDEAWEAAERVTTSLGSVAVERWAFNVPEPFRASYRMHEAFGATPSLALRALTAALSEEPR